jgi:hypothetical protein
MFVHADAGEKAAAIMKTASDIETGIFMKLDIRGLALLICTFLSA